MPDNIATADGDGSKVERLADRSQGPPTLYDGIRRGVRRLLRDGPQRALSATQLFSDQDIEEYFPVWEYMGIADGRERQGAVLSTR
jgi:hypothetical protein